MSVFTPVKRPPQLAGYRGLSVCHPPNSLASLRSAQMLGIEHVALDVQASADGRLVCYHEPLIELNDCKHEVKALALNDLSKFDLGSGQHILTLDDAFLFLRDDIHITIRVLGHHTITPLKHFFRTQVFKRSAPIYVATTDQIMLQSLSDCACYIKLALAVKDVHSQALPQIKVQGARAIVLPESRITDLLAFESVKSGLDLWACGINCFEAYQRCVMRDVKVIMSQDPAFVYDLQLKLQT